MSADIDVKVDADYGENCLRTKDTELRFEDEHGRTIDVLGATLEDSFPVIELEDADGRQIRVLVAPNFEGLHQEGESA